MNFWLCVALGIALAIGYKAYQKYKANKVAKELEEKLHNIKEDNVVIENNKEEK